MQTLTLPGFELADRHDGAVAAAVPEDEHVRVADLLPRGLRLGTSSWSFPGWAGIVWREGYPKTQLAREGLAAYSRHPLMRAVGIDRTYYGPLGQAELARYREAVDAAFRFVVKAHEDLTVARFPRHPRYGSRAGTDNPRFLDAGYATDAVVAPLVEGLGERLGPIVFQFPPQPSGALGGAGGFAGRLHAFLSALPAGPLYAVEIRNAGWLVPDYVDALRDTGAVHCLTVHPRMPPPAAQWRIAEPAMERALVCRWNLGHGLEYDAARARYEPFDRLVAEDPATREVLAELIRDYGRTAYVIVNNKAEGSAPLSVLALARRLADLRAG